jgi:NADH:ubiquinone oxidoreductase subunit 5 (subunit L)/multisubunit Na+/H+ antiporter MnhA subunit
MMVVGAWGLAGLPPFATYFGEDQIERIAGAQHLSSLSAVMMFAEVLTGAAVLRFTGRVFFGLGRGHSLASRGAPHIHMEVETEGTHSRVPAFMWVPMAALLIGALVIAIPLRRPADRFAAQFENAPAYDQAVLQITPQESSALQNSSNAYGFDQREPSTSTIWWTRVFVALGMFGLAALGIFPNPRKSHFTTWLEKTIALPLLRLRPLQSGRVGDYVAWLAFGIAAYGGMLLLLH